MDITDRVCFNRGRFGLIMTVAVVVLGYLYVREQRILKRSVEQELIEEQQQQIADLERKYRQSHSCPPCPKCPECPASEKVVEVRETVITPPNAEFVDPVREYDLRKVIDPLENPARRLARHQIPPAAVRQYLNIPTQGYPDNFHQLGLLVKSGAAEDAKNKVLRLFGRETFPGSNKYEYFTSVANGLDQIKVPIENQRNKEYYDGDSVTLEPFEGEYTVKLHPHDGPRYHPNVFY